MEPLPWHNFYFPSPSPPPTHPPHPSPAPQPNLLNDWSCPGEPRNLPSVYSADPLRAEVNLTHPTDRSCVHSTGHRSWRVLPKHQDPSFWSALRGRKTFFVITPARSCSQHLGPRQYFFFFFLVLTSLVNTFVFVGPRSMKLPNGDGKKKQKNFNSTFFFFLSFSYVKTPQGNFAGPRKLKWFLDGGINVVCGLLLWYWEK